MPQDHPGGCGFTNYPWGRGLINNEQDVMKQFLDRYIIANLQVDISEDNVAGTVERIADWMELTGWLSMPDR